MTDHPDELLAEFVDGELTPELRAEVEAHLKACDVCTEELALAAAGRTALLGLPEAEPPADLTLPLRREARRPFLGTHGARVAAAAAAAVLVVGGLLFVALSGGGEQEEAAPAPAGTSETEAPAEAQEAPEAAPAAPAQEGGALPYPQFRTSDIDYGSGRGALGSAEGGAATDARTASAAGLQTLARDLKEEANAALAQGFPANAVDFYSVFDVGALEPPLSTALQCAVVAVEGDRSLVPFVVEDAAFQGSPVYLASFLKGPAPDQPYDMIQLVVVDQESCELVTFAFQRL